MLFAVKNRLLVLSVLGIITLFFGYNLKNISFEHELDSFFNKKNNEYAFSQEFFKQFGNGQKSYESLIIGIENSAEITHDFMIKVDSLVDLIKPIKGVQKPYTILNQKLFVFTSFGRYPYKLFHLDTPSQFKEDLKLAKNYQDVYCRFVSDDDTKTLIYVPLNSDFGIDSILAVKEKIEALAEQFKFKELLFFNSKLTGNTVINKLQKESIVLTTISIGLVILILLFFFRSVKGVVVPLTVVLICVVWILGFMAFLNVPLNVLTIAIPVIVGVISLSDVIHIISRFSEEKEVNKYKKLELTQRDMLKAIVLTSVTTSFGFLSLIPSQIKVFIEFGFFTALGVLFAFVLAYFLLPILMFFVDGFKMHDSLLKTVPKRDYKKRVIMGTSVIFVLCIAGIVQVKNDSYIYDDIDATDQASKSIKMLGEDFYGIRDLSIAITLKDSTKKMLSFEVVEKLNALQTFIDSTYCLKNHTSVITLIRQMNRAMNGGQKDFFSLPSGEREYRHLLKLLAKNKQYFDINQFLSKDKKSTFIYSKIKDIGSYEINLRNEKLKTYVAQNLADVFQVTPTGGSYVLDQTNFSVTETMFYSLLTIILLIFIIISGLFRSLRVGLISLLPNVFPLLIILAIIGWFDMGINISTSIVFTIVFGIAVDDTIHFLSRYKIEKKRASSIEEAVKETIVTSGSAISLTTIILVAGFGVLMFSQFNANFLTGMFVCIGLVVALLSDLFLLPVLLKHFDKK